MHRLAEKLKLYYFPLDWVFQLDLKNFSISTKPTMSDLMIWQDREIRFDVNLG